jgi:arylsulfatase A-like enzyme
MKGDVLGALLLLMAAGGAAAASPNVLLLVAEDLSPRVGPYGDEVARTPNLDALARHSVRFDRVFTTAGVCAPSRAALITGLHQISFAAQHMRTSTGPLGTYYAQPPEGLKAFPELLRAAGYFTFTDGKLDYQFSGIVAGSGPFTLWDAEGPDAHWRQRASGQPFFGLINFLETHESGVMRPDGEAVSESHAGTREMRRQRGLVAEPVTDPAAVLLPPYYPDLPDVRRDLARHYDNIHAMDRRLGAILEQLEADGLADDTIVVWTSDHGDGLPRAKRELTDAGLRVPMLIHIPAQHAPPDWPGRGVDDRLVSFVDLAPTVLGWAGVAVPEALHGHNLLTGPQRRYVYASRDRMDEVMDRQRAVRGARYKYIRSWYPELPGGHRLEYRDNLDMVRAMRAAFEAGELDAAQRQWFEPAGEERLYDTLEDPHELADLSRDPEHAKVRRRLRDALVDWLARVGDLGRLPEDVLRARLLNDEGEVPRTPAPGVSVEDGRLHAAAANGASVGYAENGGPWRLYSGPVPVNLPVSVKAVRYGWRESPVVTVEP